MDWIAVSAIAEVVGVIGILVSLIYLAVQIRQNTRQITNSIEATRLAAFETNIESGNRIRELYILHPDLAELFLKGTRGYESLNGIDKFRFSMLLRNLFSSMQGAFVRDTTIMAEAKDGANLIQIADEVLIHAGVRQCLSSMTPDWRPEFRRFIDSRIELIEKGQE